MLSLPPMRSTYDAEEFKNTSKIELKLRLDTLGLTGKKIYMLYGNSEPEKSLVYAADLMIKKRVGEKEVLVSNARNISVSPLMECEIVVVDKSAVEILEEMYRIE